MSQESIDIAGDRFGVETIDGKKYVLGISIEEVRFVEGQFIKSVRTHPDPSLLPEGFEAVMVSASAEVKSAVGTSVAGEG